MHRKLEEERQRQRDKEFPTSLADFHAIRSKDVQVSSPFAPKRTASVYRVHVILSSVSRGT